MVIIRDVQFGTWSDDNLLLFPSITLPTHMLGAASLRSAATKRDSE
jgi:hypothetical protein